MMGSEGGTGDIGSSSISNSDESGGDNPPIDETCDPSDRGLIPRICSSLFSRMDKEGNKMEGTTYRTEVIPYFDTHPCYQFSNKLLSDLIVLFLFFSLGELFRNL